MKKLYKSNSDKILDGVCGGIAQYFKIDPVIVRLLWVVGTLIGHIFWGVVAYIVAMIIIPNEPHSNRRDDDTVITVEQDDVNEASSRKTNVWVGVGLIIIGGLFLLQNISGFHVLTYVGQLLPYVWPALLIILGIMLMMRTGIREGK